MVSTSGGFDADDAVEVVDRSGVPFAKGISRIPAEILDSVVGRRSAELPADVSPVAIHRDDLVVLPDL